MGAFDYGHYKRGMDGRENPRLAAAIVAIKIELRYTGFARPAMVGDLAYFGDAVSNSVKDFQAAKNLTVDGAVGPTTARELFRRRVVVTEDKYGLPDGALGKKIWLESLFDPVAIGGSDLRDRGMAQINLKSIELNGEPGFHDVSLAEAYSPSFAIDWAGAYLRSNYTRIASEANVMKAARASYNVGVEYAKRWMLAGFPESGGPLIGGQDSFARATQYIALIDKQVW